MPDLVEPVTSIALFAVGLVIGSFLNVCIHRLPLGESVVHPRSRCTSCGTMIRWYQNVPVVSWLALRGKCAHCGAHISWRYPFVELLTAGTVLLLWRVYGPTPAFGIAAVFFLALIVLFFTDLDHKLLPDVITLPGFLIGIAVSWTSPFLAHDLPWGRVWASVAGSALGAGVLWGIGAFYSRVRGVEAMGMGDVKMMAMVGAFTGPMGVLFTLFGGSIIGAVVGLTLIPLRGGSLKDMLPFGCFLAPTAAVALVFGQRAIEAYLRLVAPGL